jgi:hypothetical protein
MSTFSEVQENNSFNLYIILEFCDQNFLDIDINEKVIYYFLKKDIIFSSERFF